VLPIRITLNPDNSVTVHLRDSQAVTTIRHEATLDVNRDGRWVMGIELMGGAFDLAKAVEPFMPRRPLAGQSGGVTYDKQANAAYIYVPTKSEKTGLIDTDMKYWESVCLETEFGLDSKGGLVWLRFSTRDANISSAEFVSLIAAPVEPQMA